MSSSTFAKVLNFTFILFVLITFLNQYPFLMVTRVALLVFALITFLIERKKDTTPIRAFALIRFGIISLIVVFITLFIDTRIDQFPYFSRQLLIPFYMIIILGLMYMNIYGRKQH